MAHTAVRAVAPLRGRRPAEGMPGDVDAAGTAGDRPRDSPT
ncbi:hypothetical protein ACFY1L_49090 [Streptomyces sp. NPDC001663]